MRLLLDTQAVLWFRAGDPRLSNAAREAIESPENSLMFSMAGLWELAIKISLRRLHLTYTLHEFVQQRLPESAIQLLDITPEHVYELLNLPLHHRDPFDRLMMAQCLADGINFVSADAELDAYGITRIW